MVKSPLVRVLLCLAVLALIGVTALALGTKQNFTTIDNGRKVIAMKGPSVVTPRDVEVGRGSQDNRRQHQHLSVRRVFLLLWQYHLWRRVELSSTQFWEAIPFTPTANATVNRIEASVGAFGGSDAGAFQIQLLADNNNSPGDPIKTFDSRLSLSMDLAALST